MSEYTAKQIASALRISPRTKRFDIKDEYGLTISTDRTTNVLSSLANSDRSEVPCRIRTVAYALLKSIETARMNPVTSLRLRLETSPYQVCERVARIANQCPEQEIGGICDVWLPAHHAEL